MTATTPTFDAVRARIMAHIRSRGTDADPAAVHQKLELDWRAHAAVLRVHALEHLAQVRAIVG